MKEMLLLIWGALYVSYLLLVLFQCEKIEQSNQSREKLIAQLKEDAISRERHTAMMKKVLERYKG